MLIYSKILQLSTLSRLKSRQNLMCVDSDWNTERTGQTKVSKLDDSSTVYQQVLRLQISVNYAALMAKKNCLQNLVEIALKQSKFP